MSFVERLQSRGRHHFTADDAVRSLNVSLPAVRGALRRPETQGADCDAASRVLRESYHPNIDRWAVYQQNTFVPQLMEHLQQPYYVGLLSAAERWGAAHQRPQRFQVVTSSPCRPVSCGKVRVDFVVRGDMEETPVIEQNTPRGRLRVASVEATCLEIVGYVDHCAGLDNVASVLSELAPRINVRRLVSGSTPSTSRLGYRGWDISLIS